MLTLRPSTLAACRAMFAVAFISACNGRGHGDHFDAGDVAIDAAIDGRTPPSLRPLSPPSGAIVTSPRPTFRWASPDSASVTLDLCPTRACDIGVVSVAVAGGMYTPTTALAPGAHFWRLRSVGASGSAATQVWEFVVGHGQSTGAAACRTVSDFDGDGLADVAVGSPYSHHGAGLVFAFRGARSGVSTTAAATLSVGGLQYFGATLANAGDIDGDGFVDLVVGGSTVPDTNGVVWLFRGGPSGVDGTAPVRIANPGGTQDSFGAAVRGVGDIDGDGYGEVIVGAPNAGGTSGAAYVFFGSPNGIADRPAWMLSGSESGGGFGTAIGAIGDVNADGFADFAIGALGAASGAGRAYVFLGGPTRIQPQPSQVLAGNVTANEQFGVTVSAAGDVDGDGLCDLAVASSNAFSASGRAYLFRGTSAGVETAPLRFFDGPNGAGSMFGYAAASGDVNGDGFDDLLVSAICAPFSIGGMSGYPACGDGRVYAFQGGPGDHSPTVPDVALVGVDGPNTDFGFAVSMVGDTDGDGFDDVVVGTPGANGDVGRAYVFRGSPAGVVVTPAVLLDPGGRDGGNFGTVIARRVACANLAPPG